MGMWVINRLDLFLIVFLNPNCIFPIPDFSLLNHYFNVTKHLGPYQLLEIKIILLCGLNFGNYIVN